MRKSILFSLLSLIAVLAVACGGGNNAAGGNAGKGNAGSGNAGACAGGGCGGGEAAADAMAFYRKAGNYYMTKSTMKVAGNDMVTYSKFEIVKSDDKGYVAKSTSYDKDKKETFSQEMPLVEWPKPVADTGGEAPKVTTTEETIKVEAGEFECIVSNLKPLALRPRPGCPRSTRADGQVERETGAGKTESTTELVEYKYE
ncbi:MAG: hypothetical protein H6841_05020 [Planctomycetes bacterium]|nr:hypothetical protein [Planctomycetota bacterium]